MSWEVALKDLLEADVDVFAVVGTRIAPEVPQIPTFPLITYRQIGFDQDDVTGFASVWAQVTAWAETFGEAQSLEKKIRYAMQRYKGTVGGETFRNITFQSGIDLKDSETGRYTRPSDYRLNYREG